MPNTPALEALLADLATLNTMADGYVATLHNGEQETAWNKRTEACRRIKAALQTASVEACVSSVRDKTVCVSENAENERQPAPDEKPVAWGVQNNGGWFIFDAKDEARSFGNETGHPALPLFTRPQPQSDVVKALEEEIERLKQERHAASFEALRTAGGEHG